jgi:hypothetical protein
MYPLFRERQPELAKKRTCLLVILRRRHDGDVHPLGLVDLARVDLREDQVVANSEGVIATAVERLRRQAAEVADARKSDEQARSLLRELGLPFAKKD